MTPRGTRYWRLTLLVHSHMPGSDHCNPANLTQLYTEYKLETVAETEDT